MTINKCMLELYVPMVKDYIEIDFKPYGKVNILNYGQNNQDR